jgi:hypothetical protein
VHGKFDWSLLKDVGVDKESQKPVAADQIVLLFLYNYIIVITLNEWKKTF